MNFFPVWALPVCSIVSDCGTVPFTVSFLDFLDLLGSEVLVFFFSGWIFPFFSMCRIPHIFFNFSVELSHLILCPCHINFLSLLLKVHSSLFSFISYITLILRGRLSYIFPSFSKWNCCTYFYVKITKIFRIFPRLLLSENSTSFLFCVHFQTYFASISKWTLHLSYLSLSFRWILQICW